MYAAMQERGVKKKVHISYLMQAWARHMHVWYGPNLLLLQCTGEKERKGEGKPRGL